MNMPEDQPEYKIDTERDPERRAAIDYFRASFSAPIREKLDYSPKSLEIVGEWLLSRYETYEITQSETDTALLFGAVCYVGETYRESLGGYWAIWPDEPELGHSDIDEQVVAGIDKNDDEAIIRPALEFRKNLKTG